MSEFDFETALRRVGGRSELLAALADTFREEAPELMQRIQRAADEREARRLEIAAHTLKGSADVLGCQSVVRIAFTLERLGKSGDVLAAQALVPDLRAALDAALTAIEQRL